jgi:ferritin-like metal-binding protein YciE
MAVKDPKEVFVAVLSHVRQGTERSAAIYKELGELAQNPEIQEALAARAFIAEQNLGKLDQVFSMIGEKPTKTVERLQEVLVEDFRREVAEIQSPQARRLFVLAKASQVSHLRTAEFVTLVAAADLSGHYGAGVLLESCLADHLAFAERTKRLIRNVIETKVAARTAG